mgnify:CR=1 FL=1
MDSSLLMTLLSINDLMTHFPTQDGLVKAVDHVDLRIGEKEKLGLIDEYVRNKANKSDAAGFYIDWLRKRVEVYAFVFGGRWFDIGDPEFYKEAGEEFK